MTDTPTPDDIHLELARRAAASRMAAFVRATKPDYDMQPFHRAICDALDELVTTDLQVLVIDVPPQFGKSQIVSRQFPAFYFGNKPAANIISASYSFNLSKGFSQDVRTLMRQEEYQWIFPEAALEDSAGSVDRWKTPPGGAYLSSGMSGSITGNPADLIIVDDPISNREEAESKVMRDNIWQFFTGSLWTRVRPTTKLIMMSTRWNMDDPLARLLKLVGEAGIAHKHLHFPAINEAGESLWPSRWPVKFLEQTRKIIGSYNFDSLYQGNPRPRQGALAKRDWFEIVPDYPKDASIVRAWDLAATAKRTADYIVGTRLAYKDGQYWITHVYRDQISASRVEKIMLNTAILDGVRCRVDVEQEPGATGKMAAASIIKALAGYTVRAHLSTGDKFTRALPFFSQAEAGNVRLVAGSWNEDWLDEVCAFPGGRHDDQVDSASLAFNAVTSGHSGFEVT